jgi:hypothetical protein
MAPDLGRIRTSGGAPDARFGSAPEDGSRAISRVQPTPGKESLDGPSLKARGLSERGNSATSACDRTRETARLAFADVKSTLNFDSEHLGL